MCHHSVLNGEASPTDRLFYQRVASCDRVNVQGGLTVDLPEWRKKKKAVVASVPNAIQLYKGIYFQAF